MLHFFYFSILFILQNPFNRYCCGYYWFFLWKGLFLDFYPLSILPFFKHFLPNFLCFASFSPQNSFYFSVLPPQYFNPFYPFSFLLFWCFCGYFCGYYCGYFWFFYLKRLVLSNLYPSVFCRFSSTFCQIWHFLGFFALAFFFFLRRILLLRITCVLTNTPACLAFVWGDLGRGLRKHFVQRCVIFFIFYTRNFCI